MIGHSLGRMESRIKKFTPHCVCRPEGVEPDKEAREGKEHPSSVWKTSRGSNRFHFKADRLFDFTNILQVPLLDTFLKDIISTVSFFCVSATRT